MIKFYKMHGIGNDYVYIDCFDQQVADPGSLSIKLSDRHFGIGSDGLVLILPSEIADCKMRMFNSDGSEGNMCGNAVRCIGKYMHEQGRISGSKMTIETKSGIKKLDLFFLDDKITEITVDMGEPKFKPSEIPTLIDDENITQPVQIDINGESIEMTLVSMGNPHAVIFVDDVSTARLEYYGKLIETNPIFPEGINVEFVHVKDRNNIDMRVWERGSGETLACGTGACASTVACILNKKTNSDINVKLTGGELKIRWSDIDNRVYMTGPATIVFWGYVDPSKI